MRRVSLGIAITLLLLGLLANAVMAQVQVPARLTGHVVIPARTLIPAPADAPPDLQVSGKFTRGRRATQPIPGLSGINLPLPGQPVQGFSAVATQGEDFWILSDNGFGSKANSSDAMLMLHRYRFHWDNGTAERLETLFLHDPDRRIPFRLTHEDSRYLTGADFDPESLQQVGEFFWIGDEFGPFVLKVDRQDRVQTLVETHLGQRLIRSPDHPEVGVPGSPKQGPAIDLGRSRGFEGLGISPDQRFLYPMLEGPLWDPESRDWEADLRILEFDLVQEAWTGRFWRYALEHPSHAIGEISFITATTALVIERDQGQGSLRQACPAPGPCFEQPARFKRIYRIQLDPEQPGSLVSKQAFVDLLHIANPDGRSRLGSGGEALSFPFVTIESLAILPDGQILVGNDNNLPNAAGRDPGVADNNEWIRLSVPELLGKP
ncbi:MAG: esterase-like activity of phytase family protein [Thermostichales cyanobacterium SRBZ-1_bins_19]